MPRIATIGINEVGAPLFISPLDVPHADLNTVGSGSTDDSGDGDGATEVPLALCVLSISWAESSIRQPGLNRAHGELDLLSALKACNPCQPHPDCRL